MKLEKVMAISISLGTKAQKNYFKGSKLYRKVSNTILNYEYRF